MKTKDIIIVSACALAIFIAGLGIGCAITKHHGPRHHGHHGFPPRHEMMCDKCDCKGDPAKCTCDEKCPCKNKMKGDKRGHHGGEFKGDKRGHHDGEFKGDKRHDKGEGCGCDKGKEPRGPRGNRGNKPPRGPHPEHPAGPEGMEPAPDLRAEAVPAPKSK